MEFKTDLYAEGDNVVINGITVDYSQQSELKSDDNNDLKISICNQGAGFYFVIQTERWAFNDIDELLKVLNDFKAKSGI